MKVYHVREDFLCLKSRQPFNRKGAKSALGSGSVWGAAYPAALGCPARGSRALQGPPQRPKAAGYTALQKLCAILVAAWAALGTDAARPIQPQSALRLASVHLN